MIPRITFAHDQVVLLCSVPGSLEDWMCESYALFLFWRVT